MTAAIAWKTRSAHHEAEAAKEPDGAEPWGNGCEVRGCRKESVRFYAQHEVCREHLLMLGAPKPGSDTVIP